MDPLLIDVPAELLTERLLVRAPRPGDGEVINAAIVESFAELHAWMPWARTQPSIELSELWVRRSAIEFAQREDLPMLLFDRLDGSLVGASGLHRIAWDVPRFEIGYWARTSCVGRGYITETVRALTLLCFERFGAARVEIRMDPTNVRSRAVPHRLGFTLEGVLQRDTRGVDDQLRDTCVYAMVDVNALNSTS
ncbi:MAG: GNAT family N-acetyltransferase [Gammaproteobacteria bacterium]|nr:GNAT family N-acetyltransferase [Gammaproteobacteria bacterium]